MVTAWPHYFRKSFNQARCANHVTAGYDTDNKPSPLAETHLSLTLNTSFMWVSSAGPIITIHPWHLFAPRRASKPHASPNAAICEFGTRGTSGMLDVGDTLRLSVDRSFSETVFQPNYSFNEEAIGLGPFGTPFWQAIEEINKSTWYIDSGVTRRSSMALWMSRNAASLVAQTDVLTAWYRIIPIIRNMNLAKSKSYNWGENCCAIVAYFDVRDETRSEESRKRSSCLRTYDLKIAYCKGLVVSAQRSCSLADRK
ncbi:hypothetical protein F5148DRAFT_571089 [Russula earlei]|uniref:Uncharacterized protein n=1 Tax=Russula earlei TaxID=71964 RepID=A0ACC0UFV6_9AGAM|nr:hypothetical protein F5148DRAFT_571089 [Russula earlei]